MSRLAARRLALLAAPAAPAAAHPWAGCGRLMSRSLPAAALGASRGLTTSPTVWAAPTQREAATLISAPDKKERRHLK
jgi:hypothetical protein